MGGSRNIAIGLGALGFLAALALLVPARPERRAGAGAERRRRGDLCRRRHLRRHHLPRPQPAPTARSSARTRSCSGRTRRPPPARTAAPGRCCARSARARSPRGSASARPPPRADVPRLPRHARPAGAGARFQTVGRGRLRKLPRRRALAAGCRAIMRSAAPTRPTSRAASSRSTIRARAPHVCLDCHFGSADEGQFVTHRIMAAGHPADQLRARPLLDAAAASQRRRRLSPPQGPTPTAPGCGRSARRWRSTARSACSLGRRGSEGIFPEFYFFDCHTCHRQISDDPRFRPAALANPGRPIPSGMPPFNDENMIMLSRGGAGRGAGPRPALRARQPRLPRAPSPATAPRPSPPRRRCGRARGRSPSAFSAAAMGRDADLRDHRGDHRQGAPRALHRLCRQRAGGDGDRHPALGAGQQPRHVRGARRTRSASTSTAPIARCAIPMPTIPAPSGRASAGPRRRSGD